MDSVLSGRDMAANRDDFSSTVKMTLAGRAGWMCSFLGCRQVTAGPASESADKWIKNGIAAHICAAAPGGPRYDPSMTPEERSDISNAIWMCPTHGSLIDKEQNGYTVDQLRTWKISAESRARHEMENGRNNHYLQNTSPYSTKDIATLTSYCDVMSFSTIERIRSELFGSVVMHDVTDPLYEILEMKDNPGFRFQDADLERIRKTLNAQVMAFFRHFGQQSGGLPTHYEYINISERTRDDPASRPYWEEQIYEAQRLARELCSSAMQLLEIKESF